MELLRYLSVRLERLFVVREEGYYAGLSVMILAVVGLWPSARRVPAVWAGSGALAIVLVSLAFSMGPAREVWGVTDHVALRLGFVGDSRLLGDAWPDSIRVGRNGRSGGPRRARIRSLGAPTDRRLGTGRWRLWRWWHGTISWSSASSRCGRRKSAPLCRRSTAPWRSCRRGRWSRSRRRPRGSDRAGAREHLHLPKRVSLAASAEWAQRLRSAQLSAADGVGASLAGRARARVAAEGGRSSLCRGPLQAAPSRRVAALA